MLLSLAQPLQCLSPRRKPIDFGLLPFHSATSSGMLGNWFSQGKKKGKYPDSYILLISSCQGDMTECEVGKGGQNWLGSLNEPAPAYRRIQEAPDPVNLDLDSSTESNLPKQLCRNQVGENNHVFQQSGPKGILFSDRLQVFFLSLFFSGVTYF